MKNDKLTIDQAYQDLQAIVAEFENGEIDLEKSIPKFKEGLELANFLKTKLQKLKLEVEAVKAKFMEDDE